MIDALMQTRINFLLLDLEPTTSLGFFHLTTINVDAPSSCGVIRRRTAYWTANRRECTISRAMVYNATLTLSLDRFGCIHRAYQLFLHMKSQFHFFGPAKLILAIRFSALYEECIDSRRFIRREHF